MRAAGIQMMTRHFFSATARPTAATRQGCPAGEVTDLLTADKCLATHAWRPRAQLEAEALSTYYDHHGR